MSRDYSLGVNSGSIVRGSASQSRWNVTRECMSSLSCTCNVPCLHGLHCVYMRAVHFQEGFGNNSILC